MTKDQEIEIRTIYAARSAIRRQGTRTIDFQAQCLRVQAGLFPDLHDKIYAGWDEFCEGMRKIVDECAPFPEWYKPESPDRFAIQEVTMPQF